MRGAIDRANHIAHIEEATKVLLVEDNPADAWLLQEMLDEPSLHKIELIHVARIGDMEKHIEANSVDVILLDLGLPDAQGLAAVRQAHPIAPHIPLIVLTGLDDETLATHALKEGAQDYLVKGQIVGRGIRRAIRYAIERKTIEETLFAEQERARVTLNSIGDAVISADIFGNVTFMNRVATTMIGWSRQEAYGKPLSAIFNILDGATRDAIVLLMDRGIEAVESAQRIPNCILLCCNGQELIVEYSSAPISDRTGRIVGTVIAFHDVSKTRAMELRMSYLAQHDFLTDLPNRALLNDRLTQVIALATRMSSRLGVLFVDLDCFKHINDSLGHSIGDRLLQSVASRLTGCVRNSDTVSRVGGDEFVILLADIANASDAALVASKALLSLTAPHHVGQYDFHISASIGVSTFPDDGSDGETLIKNADLAMYEAKKSGRNNYQIFQPGMNARAVERQSLENCLRLALERNEFVLHYQPQLNLETGAITGAEALIRWEHPERGLIPPAQFIPIAEENGLILPIGQWALYEACRQAKSWSDSGLSPIRMAVNISAVQFRRKFFFETIREMLAELDYDPHYLELELTETVLMDEASSTISVLSALKNMGVHIAIDDFGTGYSSLSYLTRFPIDTLKIDRSFVNEITANVDGATIVRAVIGLGKSLKLKVVAEGIEAEPECVFLRSNQCPEGQGYYFSRPIVATAFTELLQSGVSAHKSFVN